MLDCTCANASSMERECEPVEEKQSDEFVPSVSSSSAAAALPLVLAFCNARRLSATAASSVVHGTGRPCKLNKSKASLTLAYSGVRSWKTSSLAVMALCDRATTSDVAAPPVEPASVDTTTLAMATTFTVSDVSSTASTSHKKQASSLGSPSSSASTEAAAALAGGSSHVVGGSVSTIGVNGVEVHGAPHLLTISTPTSSQFRQSLNTRSLPTEHCDCATAFAKEQKLVGTAPVNALWLMNLCETIHVGYACRQ